MKLNKLIKYIELDYLKLDLFLFKIGNIVLIDVLI